MAAQQGELLFSKDVVLNVPGQSQEIELIGFMDALFWPVFVPLREIRMTVFEPGQPSRRHEYSFKGMMRSKLTEVDGNDRTRFSVFFISDTETGEAYRVSFNFTVTTGPGAEVWQSVFALLRQRPGGTVDTDVFYNHQKRRALHKMFTRDIVPHIIDVDQHLQIGGGMFLTGWALVVDTSKIEPMRTRTRVRIQGIGDPELPEVEEDSLEELQRRRREGLAVQVAAIREATGETLTQEDMRSIEESGMVETRRQILGPRQMTFERDPETGEPALKRPRSEAELQQHIIAALDMSRGNVTQAAAVLRRAYSPGG